jgi:hypothetical protein
VKCATGKDTKSRCAAPEEAKKKAALERGLLELSRHLRCR